ncbi:MAG TPA: PatB family C-S lyase [Prolixibacteraceae bacterium]|nr:PatB family C-S lyase [Prolixibacteraceae bacterium]
MKSKHAKSPFDEVINRVDSNCEKWDDRLSIFGRKDVLPLWVADTDFQTPKFIVDAVKKRADHEVYGYPMIPTSFYDSIRLWMEQQHGWNIQQDWISYAPNVVVALASLVLSLTLPGDKIIVQPPVYFPFFHVVGGNGRIVTENPLIQKGGKYVIDFDDLEKKIDDRTRMLLLCNPHNPGGRVWSKEELTELGRICFRHSILIVSDEIHSDLTLPGYRHTPFGSIGEEYLQNSITVSSASKTFNMAGLSSAYVIVPNEKAHRRYKELMKATHISSGNFFGLVATEAAYREGHEWLQELRLYLDGNARFVASFLSERMPRVKLMKPESTFLLWIDLSGLGLKPEDAFQRLVQAGLGLSPGWLFGTGGEAFVRMNIGCPRSLLGQALVLFEKAFS